MKTALKLLVLSQLLLVSTISIAREALTAQQCNDYPFVHTGDPLHTHR